MAAHDVVNPAVTLVLIGVMTWNAGRYLIDVLRGQVVRDKNNQVVLINAACCLVQGLIAFADQDWPGVGFYAVVMAASLFVWWLGGGGKGTKRRLKKLKEKFAGKRRTAPVIA